MSLSLHKTSSLKNCIYLFICLFIYLFPGLVLSGLVLSKEPDGSRQNPDLSPFQRVWDKPEIDLNGFTPSLSQFLLIMQCAGKPYPSLDFIINWDQSELHKMGQDVLNVKRRYSGVRSGHLLFFSFFKFPKQGRVLWEQPAGRETETGNSHAP